MIAINRVISGFKNLKIPKSLNPQILKLFLLGLFSLVSATLLAQQSPPAFWNEIQAFKKQDSLQPPPAHAILLAGSSSFRFWSDVQKYFPGKPIINRGFGGSSLPDLIRYAPDIIYPYRPKQVVIYCGENDFAASDTVTVQTVVNRFKTLHGLIRHHLGNVPIVFVSIKPAPSRRHLMPKEVAANAEIKKFLQKDRNAVFADVYNKMLDQQGQPMKNIFIQDSLHMNPRGYAIWQKVLDPYLLK